MRGGEHMTSGVVRPPTPSDALRVLEELLRPFRNGEQLFITARTNSPRLAMWRTQSKATALYWCASAFAKLWRSADDATQADPTPGPNRTDGEASPA
ncbi:MAG TPA: hypothetical protein VI299_00190 [Polyangiales bacterium]